MTTIEEDQALDDLEATALATDLKALLEKAEAIFLKREQHANALRAKCQHVEPPDADEHLAEALLDNIGAPDDIWLLHKIAKTLAETRMDAEDALKPAARMSLRLDR